MKGNTKAAKLPASAIAVLFVLSAFLVFGFAQPAAHSVPQASPASSLIAHDMIVGGGFGIPSWSLSGGTMYIQGNLTVMAGGLVTLNNETLVFDDFANGNNLASYESAPLFHLIVEDGGKLIMHHSTITTNLNLIDDIPVLGVYLQNGADLVMEQRSALTFPGQFVSLDSNITMINSTINGPSPSSFNKQYINETVFPPGLFANPPVMSLFGGNVLVVNSSVSIFENNSTSNDMTDVFVENYPFASDTNQMENVTYTLEALPTSVFHQNPLADTTTDQQLSNLTAFDQLSYNILAGQRLSVTNFTFGGVTQDLSSVQLNVAYKSQSGGAGTAYWTYGNMSVPEGSLPLPSSSTWSNVSLNLPPMTAGNLARLQVWINDSTGTLLINKLWLTFSVTYSAFRHLLIAGSSSFTAINSYIGVNFNPKRNLHTSVIVDDAAHAYMYGVRVNAANFTNMTKPAMEGASAALQAKPLSFGPLNTPVAGDQLPKLEHSGVYYATPSNGVFQTYGMNISRGTTLNSVISSATLYFTSNSSTGSMIYVGEEGQPVSSYVATGVRISDLITYSINLYNLGFTNLSQIANLVVYINDAGTGVPLYLSNMYVQVSVIPQIYLYRFAGISIYSEQGLPVSGSSLLPSYAGSTPDNTTPGSPASYFVAPLNNYQQTPPQTVLSYLGRTSTSYSVTNQFGSAVIPLMTDVIYSSVYPDSLYVGNYTLDIQFNGSSYGSSVSFPPFPNVTASTQFMQFNVSISVLLPLPVISVSRPLIQPGFLYAGQNGTVEFNVSNSGSTGVTNMPVNISDSASGKLVSYRDMEISVGPKSTVTVSIPWKFTHGYNNSIAVLANPNRTVPEPYYGGDFNSTIYFVEPNLPELVVTSSGISFSPSTAYTGKPVEITAIIENFLGRANATNVSVSFYAGNPLSGGTFIGDSVVNVSAGAANSTSIHWIPNIIGSIPVYVYVDPSHNLTQYSRAGNLNYSILNVQLTTDEQDLVVNNSNSGPNNPFIIDTTLNMSSNVIVTQSGYLWVGGGFNFIESSANQYAIVVNQSAKLVLKDGTITSNFALNMFAYDHSSVYFYSSSVGSTVDLVTGGNAFVYMSGTSFSGGLVTAPSSSATINAYNTTFSTPLTIGYSEVAHLFNTAAPSVSAQSSAVAYIYRWLSVTVYGPSSVVMPQSNVTVYSFSNTKYLSGNVYAKMETNSSGVALFAGLSDTITGSGDVYSGNYMVNASVFNEKTWYAPEIDVSLAHYTAPLLQQNANVSMQLVILLPQLVVTPSDISVLPVQSTQSKIVEGSNATVTALVFNLGYAPVTQNFTVTFLLPGMPEVNVTTALTSPLLVGEAVPVETVWQVPMSYGNMTITVLVNGARTLPEASYRANTASLNVTVFSLPLLMPQSMTVTGTFQEYGNLTFNVYIVNKGQTDAGPFVVSILEGNSTSDINTVVANGTEPGLDAFGSEIAHINWTVPAFPAGVRTEHLYFTAVVDSNHSVREASYAQSELIQPVSVNITQAQVNASVSISSTSVRTGSVMIVTVDVVSKSTGKALPSYPVTVELYNFRGQPEPSVTIQATTSSNGLVILRVPIPASVSSGTYHFNVYSNGQFISASQSFNIASSAPSTGFSPLYLLIIVAAAIAAFGGFSLYLYRYGLARVVECGNCGAFIPETSKRCPYCGVEFEAGTAKCSNCSSWIPANSKQCPICGVKFADEGEAEKEDEYTAGMRREYAAFVEKFKSQAKAEMGKRYSEKAFLGWWKKQPTYLSFEDWLSRQQSIRKAKMVPCPVCGEPNPESAKECVKCGSPMASAPQKEVQPQQVQQPVEEKKPQQEPRRVVVPKKIIRKVEEKQPQEQQKDNQEGNQ